MSKEVKRYDCTDGGARFCQGCYTMSECEFGEYVSWDDYESLLAERDRLSNELTEARRLFVRDTDELIAERDAAQKDAERYRWLCEKFGVTKLPCAIERILAGEAYVADGKASIDAAIDAALQGEQP